MPAVVGLEPEGGGSLSTASVIQLVEEGRREELVSK